MSDGSQRRLHLHHAIWIEDMLVLAVLLDQLHLRDALLEASTVPVQIENPASCGPWAIAPVEVWEQRNPWLVEQMDLAADSGGAGRHRGGLGIDLSVRVLEHTWLTAVIDRTRNRPWGLWGGLAGRPNSANVLYPDGRQVSVAKATRVSLPSGATVQLHTGGGGGYGPPEERAQHAINADLEEGYVTEDYVRRFIRWPLPPGDRCLVEHVFRQVLFLVRGDR